MGCGNSKLNPEGRVVPPRIRPLLRHRFSELRKRRNFKDGTLSKKGLLKDGQFEEENSLLVGCKSFSSSEVSTKSSIIAVDHKDDDDSTNKQAKDTDANKRNSDLEKAQQLKDIISGKNEFTLHVGLLDSQRFIIKLQDLDKEDKKKDEGDENNDDADDDDGDDEEEEAHCAEEDDERSICPGSPSFRVYFAEETKNNKDNMEMTGGEGNKSDVPHQSHDSAESVSSGEVKLQDQPNKKAKKGRSFKKAISKTKSGPVAVKNLLNVKACYHIGCAGNHRATLLARKHAA